MLAVAHQLGDHMCGPTLTQTAFRSKMLLANLSTDPIPRLDTLDPICSPAGVDILPGWNTRQKSLLSKA